MVDGHNEWLGVEGPDDGEAHGAECGCALPDGVAFAITVMKDGRVALGRKVPRVTVRAGLAQIVAAIDLMESVDQIERDMEGE